MSIELKKDFKYSLVVPTSMGIRITPLNGQPVHSSDQYKLQVTSAETNVASISSYLGLPVKVLTNFVKDSPIARLIKSNLKNRFMDYEGKDVPQGGPWGYRHQFNIADSGFGSRGPRVHNDRAGEVGRILNVKDFDLDRLFGNEGVQIIHLSGLIAALSPDTSTFCLELARSAKKYGTKISFDLNYRASFWKGREEELSAAFTEIASVSDILVGNEEDFQLCLGIQGPEAGGEGLESKIDGFKEMIGRVKEEFPNASVFATTLREVVNANQHLWGAIMFEGNNWHVIQPRAISVTDRIGGGDGFVGGLLYGILKNWDPEKWIQFGWATGAMATTFLTDYAQPADEEMVWSIWEGNARGKKMIYYRRGSEDDVIDSISLKEAIISVFDKMGMKKRVLAIPPDYTRFHSQAGEITTYIYDYYKDKLTDILPALGTHFPMSETEINSMFPGIPQNLFRVHNWKKDLITLGQVPSEFVKEVSEGKVDYSWPAQVNKLLVENNFDLILSIGQVVPHEVVGMANYNKNIFVGTGGSEGINKSHFLGAVYGMERMMGRADTPVRKVLNYASQNFAGDLPIVYIQTVIGKNDQGKLVIRGLYIGDDYECFKLAADLSLKVNFEMLEFPLKKVVVYLDPSEFKSTWLGNKSIYRTRMAIADGGELIVMAPGLREFGEDPVINELIRKYGYVTTPEVLKYVKENEDLKNNLSAAAHLIHGSSENRFKVTYCPGNLSKEEIESVNFNYADLSQMTEYYDPDKLIDGFNRMPDGEDVFYISNPALGLWAHKDKFVN